MTRKTRKGLLKDIKSKNLEPFQVFTLKHLLEFIKARFDYELNPDNKINKLRNTVMHGVGFIEKEDKFENDYIYNYESFSEFFDRVKFLKETANFIYNIIVFDRYCV